MVVEYVAEAAKRTPDAVESSLVITKANGRQQSYPMFQVAEIEHDTARLCGPLLLEVGEVLLVEIVFTDGSKLRASATVEAVQLDPDPGIRVAFTRAAEKKAIRKKLANLRR